MPSLGGTDLCKVLHVRKNNVERKASSLFSNFEIFHMNKQVRATCEMQQLYLDNFRHIPNNFYPSGYQ